MVIISFIMKIIFIKKKKKNIMNGGDKKICHFSDHEIETFLFY